MEPALLSDNPDTVSALAEWLEQEIELSPKQATILASGLLCRKEPKIKRSPLAQLVKSLNVGESYDRVRELLITTGLLRKVRGQNGSVSYEICLDAAGIDVLESVEDAEDVAVADADDAVDEGGLADARDASDEEDSAEQDDDACEGDLPEPDNADGDRDGAPEDVPEADAGERDSSDEADGVTTDEPDVQETPVKPVKVSAGAVEKRAGAKNAGAPKPSASKDKAADDGASGDQKKAQGAQDARGRRSRNRKGNQTGAKETGAAQRHERDAQKRSGKNGAAIKPRREADDLRRIRTWIAAHQDEPVAYASRRQRAYQIFDDEKALEGKRGERLMRRMAASGLNYSELKISSTPSTPLQGFFAIGSDQPFLVVENIDAYEEIVSLLRTKRHIRLFGTRIGGVIFGAGHNVCMAHALDEYLHGIGYRFDYVYYAGDIDREGARLVERAREVNVIDIRLHAGIYRAMLAAHKEHLKSGSACESAARNQDFPRNLTEVVRGLPITLRVPFKRALRDNIRIPQEVLTSADFQRGSLSGVIRLLNR